MPGRPIMTSDQTTRTYLDEIGAIPLIDHRTEQQHGLAIERRQHIRDLRAQAAKPRDSMVTDRMLRYINGCAPTISGLFRHAGLAPDPRLSEVAHNPAFRTMVDCVLTPDVTDTARRWSGIADDEILTRHMHRLSLDTASLTDAAIHVTDDCRISRLEQHLSDPDYPGRLRRLDPHLSRQLDGLVATGNRHQEALANANLRLVVSVANNFSNYNVPLLDLIQEGNIGLMIAAERYNHRMGTRFSTYATWWIRHHTIQCITKENRTIRLPEHKVKLITKINATRLTLSQELGRLPTNEEVADFLELEVDLIENADSIRQPTVNLDQPISDDSETLLLHTIAAEGPSVDDEVASRALPETIRKALSGLSEQEQAVIVMRYGLADDTPLTVSAIAKDLGVTNQRVRETEHQAIAKLQSVPALRAMLVDYAQ